ncbi:integrin-linked protein kinase [Anopheles aquasalis]|uniref:Integrin-linked protein kinase n=1 Tax=Anopheles darlingi TaxID=43151 RepID=W5J4S2_ANODA|nr:integrin-linked protein kinase [Anopheles darlingi]XP_050094764.1 integrin-linked protein kinase [Anopheles aquasalis]ETN59472.1 integrin-linked protein kinase [Anopheles darlingi]
MEDIFHWCREGNSIQVRLWLDDTEHDMNLGDDHGFSPLHWCAKEGHGKLVEMLLHRGARVNATNMGDDIPLHLASAHGHLEIVQMLIRHRSDVNAANEHGNTPLHYACFWGYQAIAEELVNNGALISLANKDGDTPLDKAKSQLATRLHNLAVESGQELKKISFKDQGSWLGMKTRSRDATLSRFKGINVQDLTLHNKIAITPGGETWRGRWQNNDIIAKVLSVRECNARIARDFNEEFPKLRIFSHPNILPVIGACNSPPSLIVISQYMPRGSLYDLLHGGSGIVVDTAQAVRFALDIARGMAYLHSLERIIPEYHLSSFHVMIDDDLTARINMADAKFSFQERGRVYQPAWMSPETLQKKRSDRNWEACDMWSFAICIWELATREVPFAELTPMEAGMRIATEGLRVSIPPGTAPHLSKLIKICMNEDPGKRPTFDMIIPILDKMKR